MGRVTPGELKRQRYLEQQRIERDAANLVAAARAAEENARTARQLGFDEGRGKGFDEGIEKGEVIGRIRLLQRLLGQPQTATAELHRLPLQDLVQQEATLDRQLSSPKPANGSAPTEQT